MAYKVGSAGGGPHTHPLAEITDEGALAALSTVGTTQIDNDAVSNVKMANMAQNTIKGRITASTGDPEDLSAANVRTIINVADGANNYSHPNHSGDVTSVGDGAQTIANDAVTFAKMQNIATDRLLGRDTAATGDVEELSVSGGVEFTGSGGIQTSAFTGDVAKAAGGTALTIANDAVTYAKMQNVSATDKVLGRSTAGSGDVEEIACTAAGRALIDDADAAAQRTTLGVPTQLVAAASAVNTTSTTTGISTGVAFALTNGTWLLHGTLGVFTSAGTEAARFAWNGTGGLAVSACLTMITQFNASAIATQQSQSLALGTFTAGTGGPGANAQPCNVDTWIVVSTPGTATLFLRSETGGRVDVTGGAIVATKVA